MTIDSKMFSCLFIQFFWIDWFAVFDDDMYFFYTWEMCFKNVSSIVHADRNDRTPGLFGNFKCTVTEWKHRKLFAIVAGSFRENADGNAIGGLAVGEPTEKMYEMIEVVNEILPTDKPRYLMGVGTPVNILEGIERGVDMFDCVMPTRNGRNGMLFTKDGIMNMRNKKWENDYSPIEADGASYVDTMYSRAYLRHLFHAQELLAMQIASIHNLAFYLWLVGEARKHIIAGDFSTWKPAMVKRLSTRL